MKDTGLDTKQAPGLCGLLDVPEQEEALDLDSAGCKGLSTRLPILQHRQSGCSDSTAASSQDSAEPPRTEPCPKTEDGDALLSAAASLRAEMRKKSRPMPANPTRSVPVVATRKRGKCSPEGVLREGQALARPTLALPAPAASDLVADPQPAQKKQKLVAGSADEEAFRRRAWRIALAVIEMYRAGCSTCRWRKGCCESCWKKRGYSAAAAKGGA